MEKSQNLWVLFFGVDEQPRQRYIVSLEGLQTTCLKEEPRGSDGSLGRVIDPTQVTPGR